MMRLFSDFFAWTLKFRKTPTLLQGTVIYMNDIIVFSADTQKHLTHLKEVLDLLEKSGVTLAFKKCRFAYSNIKVLGHYVFRLGMSILEEKIKAIEELKFPKTLHELETAIGFFGYYRSS